MIKKLLLICLVGSLATCCILYAVSYWRSIIIQLDFRSITILQMIYIDGDRVYYEIDRNPNYNSQNLQWFQIWTTSRQQDKSFYYFEQNSHTLLGFSISRARESYVRQIGFFLRIGIPLWFLILIDLLLLAYWCAKFLKSRRRGFSIVPTNAPNP